jgi:CBS domain-containing protein
VADSDVPLRSDRRVPVDEGTVAVYEIMTTDVLTVAATANAGAVADRLRRHGELRVLPIVDGGRLVGVVTRGDLLRRLLPGPRRGGVTASSAAVPGPTAPPTPSSPWPSSAARGPPRPRTRRSGT